MSSLPLPTVELAGLSWTEVANRAGSTLLVVPIGSTEQHGPHLPLSVDTDIAGRLCTELASRRPDVLIAPAVAYGSSGEHAGFAGTLSIGQAALEQVLIELGRSADDFAGVLLVSTHGGNAAVVKRAEQTLRSEGRRVKAWIPTAPGGPLGDAHAGRTETSVMLALDPDSVRSERLAEGCTRPIGELMPQLVASGVKPLSPNGILGDARDSNPDDGAQIVQRWSDDLFDFVKGWP